MAGGLFSRLNTRTTGGTITASDDDNDLDNIISNLLPAKFDDYSVNNAQMDSMADPYPGSSQSLATTLAGEIERLRFQIELLASTMDGSITKWYEDPPAAGALVTLTGTQTLTNKTLTTPIVVTGGAIVDAGGDEYLEFIEVAVPANHLKVSNSAAGNDPSVTAAGTDDNINVDLIGKGTGSASVGGVKIVTISDSQTLTNKSIDADNNTITNIGQGGLKTATATGSVSVNNDSSASLALTNTYSWWTGSADFASSGGKNVMFGSSNTAAGTIGLANEGTQPSTFYIDERYVQSSPPYNIGSIKWGHFLFVLRTVGTGEVRGAYESADPPWGSRALWIADKNSTERMLVAPHNFADYWDKDPATDGLEIVMVDLRGFDIDALKLFCQKEEVRLRKGVKPWEELLKTITVGDELPYDTFGIVPITGLTDRMKIVGRT